MLANANFAKNTFLKKILNNLQKTLYTIKKELFIL